MNLKARYRAGIPTRPESARAEGARLMASSRARRYGYTLGDDAPELRATSQETRRRSDGSDHAYQPKRMRAPPKTCDSSVTGTARWKTPELKFEIETAFLAWFLVLSTDKRPNPTEPKKTAAGRSRIAEHAVAREYAYRILGTRKLGNSIPADDCRMEQIKKKGNMDALYSHARCTLCVCL